MTAGSLGSSEGWARGFPLRVGAWLSAACLFDYVVPAALLLNAITIGVQVDHALKHGDEGGSTPRWSFSRVSEQIFCAIFSGELVARIVVCRWDFLYGPDRRWNLFDSAVTAAHFTEVVSDAISGGGGGAGLARTEEGARFASFTGVLQVVRILRVFRLVRFVRELHKLILLIQGSMVSFAWTVALLLLLTYICGVFFAQIVADHRRGGGDMSDDLQEYFGSLRSSLISLFAAISGGVDWSDVLRPLREDISPWLSVIFCLYIAFAVLVMMNLVTGVFVDRAKYLGKTERHKELLRKLDRVFRETDSCRLGYITLQDFQACCHRPGMKEFLASLHMETSEAAAVFAKLDRDGNDMLTLEEFVAESFRLCGTARAFDVAMMRLELSQSSRLVEARVRSLEDLLTNGQRSLFSR